MIILALTRRLPYGAAGTALRFLFLFFLLNTMVSGDIFTDRETWGMMMLLLMLAPATRTVTSLPAAERVRTSIDPSLRLVTADR